MKKLLHSKTLWVLVSVFGAAFLWWTISPLFIDKTINDSLPPRVDTTGGNAADISPGATPAQYIEGPFTIIGTPTHPAGGSIRLFLGTGRDYVRYENYQGTNGPDLRIYLAKDLEATEFVDLGEAKGNQGNINYAVPNDVDIDEYKYVLTWCRAFGVLFDYAEIQ